MMELDVSEEAAAGLRLETKLFSVPDEIWLKIFRHLDPLDVLALARSCRFFSKICDNFEQIIWHYQWYKLVSKHTWLSLNLPSVQSLSDLGVAFKDCCRRLWSIISVGGSYPKCVHCKVRNPPEIVPLRPILSPQNYSCGDECLKERSSKVVMDIGGKWTW